MGKAVSRIGVSAYRRIGVSAYRRSAFGVRRSARARARARTLLLAEKACQPN